LSIVTIILTDGPYISEHAEIAYKIARAALKNHKVNIFLYLEACPRCATARGYSPAGETSRDYLPGIRITSLYNLAGMIEESDRVISLSR
jgi:tRNA 2-thiouridine synthesizing protein D